MVRSIALCERCCFVRNAKGKPHRRDVVRRTVPQKSQLDSLWLRDSKRYGDQLRIRSIQLYSYGGLASIKGNSPKPFRVGHFNEIEKRNRGERSMDDLVLEHR